MTRQGNVLTRLPVSLALDIPEDPPSLLWQLTASLSYRTKDYKNLSQPGGIARDDRLTNVFVQGVRRLSANWEAFASLDYFANSSSMGPAATDDKNFTELVGYAGATWKIGL